MTLAPGTLVYVHDWAQLLGGFWVPILDGDARARYLYHRHYSRYRYRDGRRPKLILGPGEKMLLLTPDASAVFGWRKFHDDSGQVGVNCAVFRNEGPYLSSELIREADRWAWRRWTGERLYTYVNPTAIHSSNPGFCFLQAGWRRLKQRTSKGLRILEMQPEWA